MSSVTVTRVTRTNLVKRDYLIKALEDLGYAWTEGGRIGLLGRRLDIKIKGRNAGFRKAGNCYDLVTRGTTLNLKKIIQRYVYHAACAKLEAQGFTLAQEEVKESGRIHLVLRRMA
jgi:hypothetical protein